MFNENRLGYTSDNGSVWYINDHYHAFFNYGKESVMNSLLRTLLISTAVAQAEEKIIRLQGARSFYA